METLSYTIRLWAVMGVLMADGARSYVLLMDGKDAGLQL